MNATELQRQAMMDRYNKDDEGPPPNDPTPRGAQAEIIRLTHERDQALMALREALTEPVIWWSSRDDAYLARRPRDVHAMAHGDTREDARREYLVALSLYEECLHENALRRTKPGT